MDRRRRAGIWAAAAALLALLSLMAPWMTNVQATDGVVKTGQGPYEIHERKVTMDGPFYANGNGGSTSPEGARVLGFVILAAILLGACAASLLRWRPATAPTAAVMLVTMAGIIAVAMLATLSLWRMSHWPFPETYSRQVDGVLSRSAHWLELGFYSALATLVAALIAAALAFSAAGLLDTVPGDAVAGPPPVVLQPPGAPSPVERRTRK